MPIQLFDPNQPREKRHKALAIISLAALLIVAGVGYTIHALMRTPYEQPEYLQCKQVAPIEPDFDSLGLHSSSEFLLPEYQKHSAELMTGAIRIPTVSYDDMDVDVEKDDRFRIFNKLHKYLNRNFPLTSRYAEKINTYGLLYTIEGTDPDLKPVVLMAHQDVVPVTPETLDQWTEDPFAGVFDGEWIYGRGTVDTKNTLIGIHEAVEALLKQGWKPKRTLLLSFGFDEEISGFRGARKISEHIEKVYGKDSVDLVLDEGFGIEEVWGTYFASPSVAEKGRVQFRVTLKTPGGHSSMPPDHTGIGIMSDLVTLLESYAPFEPSLLEGVDSVKAQFSCFGHHADDSMPTKMRGVFAGSGYPGGDKRLAEMLGDDFGTRILVETTQAVDVIHGGVKVNALPEEVVLEVNYRIKPASSVQEETETFLSRVKEVATKFDLGLNYTNSFRGSDDPHVIVPLPKEYNGIFVVETTDELDVAPISPFFNSTQWDLLSGTIKNVVENTTSLIFDDHPLIVSPGLMPGNTDTAHFWNLTSNIYRFIPVMLGDTQNIHTVNEALRFRSHISTVAFYYEFLINALHR